MNEVRLPVVLSVRDLLCLKTAVLLHVSDPTVDQVALTYWLGLVDRLSDALDCVMAIAAEEGTL